ncbi:hypothetical protein PT300_00405 [Enterobacteriaceae bacterium ESL0689]|nr:hypothetical protein [Enterobacteriaceae bacterium ESL0689]
MPQLNQQEHPTSLRAFLRGVPVVERMITTPRDTIVADYVRRYAGPPACGRASAEPVVRYMISEEKLPVLMGCFGDEQRVRERIPHLPRYLTQASLRQLLAHTVSPETMSRHDMPPGNAYDCTLKRLPVLTHNPRRCRCLYYPGIYLRAQSTW